MAVLSTSLLLAGCGSGDGGSDEAEGGSWSFTDGSGKTVELPETPKRITAHAYSAAALMAYGINPVAVYADMPVEEDVGLRGVDLEGVELLGEEWGKIDLEKAAALDPDLIVADYWPVEESYSGMENGDDCSHRTPEDCEARQVWWRTLAQRQAVMADAPV
ncbi:MAG TPA: hypothetical protein VFQ28_04970 [Gaiella sp.]|nr:hypothetical protein [Gaiella sp.]